MMVVFIKECTRMLFYNFFYISVYEYCVYKVPYNLYVTTVQYVCKYCVVCSPCVLLVEYVCKYCVNMCVNTVGMCVALHATRIESKYLIVIFI